LKRAEILPLHVLHRDVVVVALLVEVVDLHDVRMRERGGDPRLVQEHVDELLLGVQVREDALDHDDALEPAVVELHGAKDLGHPPDRHAIEEEVATERLRRETPRHP
jgi:hypothetical protein